MCVKLPTRVRYGARAIAEIACAYPDRLVPLRDVAEALQVSAKYMEQIVAALRSAGLVRARRGASGGYRLTRRPEEITMADVFRALEGPISLVDCSDGADCCPMREHCPTRETWSQMAAAMEEVLEGTALSDLVDRLKSGAQGADVNFDI